MRRTGAGLGGVTITTRGAGDTGLHLRWPGCTRRLLGALVDGEVEAEIQSAGFKSVECSGDEGQLGLKFD